MKMKDFKIVTTTKSAKYIFFTKAICGKNTVKNLITYSGDFRNMLGMIESNSMDIKIRVIQNKGGKT